MKNDITYERKVIKKIFKKGGHAHHGGAWKIAYADFVTAMMAFFLMMWLVNSVSVEQKKGIADYFTPHYAKTVINPGSDGILAGKNIMGDAFTEKTGSLSEQDDDPNKESAPPNTSTDPKNVDNTGTNKAIKEAEETDEEKRQKQKILKKTEEVIKKNLESNVEIRSMMEQIQLEMTDEGLNINIVDKQDRSMFPPGSYDMYDFAKNIFSEVAQSIRSDTNKIGISGHTDIVPFSNTKNYTNWELSSDRANAVRRVLETAGITADRIEYVRGRESRELINKNNPSAPENRRITITILK